MGLKQIWSGGMKMTWRELEAMLDAPAAIAQPAQTTALAPTGPTALTHTHQNAGHDVRTKEHFHQVTTVDRWIDGHHYSHTESTTVTKK